MQARVNTSSGRGWGVELTRAKEETGWLVFKAGLCQIIEGFQNSVQSQFNWKMCILHPFVRPGLEQSLSLEEEKEKEEI